MRGLILCGGRGTRLRPLTHTASKQLVPVANKPILFYVIENMVKSGIHDIGVVINPETGAEIMETIDNSLYAYDNHFAYIVQDKPGGLAHAVKISKNFLRDDPFVMYLGDNLTACPIGTFIEDFEKEEMDALVILKEVDNPSRFGVVELDADSKLVKLVEKPEKPPSNLALVGVYVFSPIIHEVIETLAPSKRGELEITDAIQSLLSSGKKVGWRPLTGWWLDTGKKDDLLTANTEVLDEWGVRDIAKTADVGDSTITGRVSIGLNTLVYKSTLRGPLVIGNNCIIVNSFIGPFTSIGNESNVHDSAIEHSVLMTGVDINQVDRIEDSVLGNNVKVCHHNRRGSLQLLLGDDSVVEF